MSKFRKIARRIRHVGFLENAEGIWSLARKPYYKLLNVSGKGVAVTVGESQAVRIPPEFTNFAWEDYEIEAISRTIKWLRANPRALVLDIGCSTGFFSVVSLAASSGSEVIAFDSDAVSLNACRRMCHYEGGERLQLIHGLLDAENQTGRNLAQAHAATQATLAKSPSGDPGTNEYICLDSPVAAHLPHYSLDGLMIGNPKLKNRPVLLKCDVEGAELLVLEGATKLLETIKPVLALSVHPPSLPNYGHSVEAVNRFLDKYNYETEVLTVDHEEHWWCEPR